MNVPRKLIPVSTTVIMLMENIHVGVGMAIDYLTMEAPALVRHYAIMLQGGLKMY